MHITYQNFRGNQWEALVQSQVRFNRVPEKVPEKVWEALVQSQVRFNKASEKVPEPCCKAKSGSTGSGEVCRSQARSGSFKSQIPRGVSSAWLRSTLQKDL